jgi:hypothetical protein
VTVAVGVGKGATLGGTGTVGGSPGTLTVDGDVDFASGSTLAVHATGLAGDTNANRSRLFSPAGTLTFGGFTVNVTKFGTAAEDVSGSYTVADFMGIGSSGLDSPLTVMGTNGSASAGGITFNVSGFASPHAWSLRRTNNTLVVSFSPVPEPSTALVDFGTGLGAAKWRRRRRAGDPAASPQATVAS